MNDFHFHVCIIWLDKTEFHGDLKPFDELVVQVKQDLNARLEIAYSN